MACYSPLDAWQTDSGEIVFAERGAVHRALRLPCGQCVGCRLERSRQWAVRVMHEAALHEDNSFITLTYDGDHLPARLSLDYREFQLFFKRLRKAVAPIRVRFFMAGEYGDKNGRPHFHACVFGYSFPDRLYFRTLPSGSKIYRSAFLESLWPFGYSSVGDVTFDSAAYVARYIMKKVTGDARGHYTRVDCATGEIYEIEPEFCRMSLKPGVGANWLKKYQSDVFPHGYVVVNGVKASPPRYYMKRYAEADFSEYDYMVYLRGLRFNPEDNTDARLRVREIVTRSRLNFKKRGLE